MPTPEYFEMPGSPTEDLNVEDGKQSATRVFECNWADRYTLRDILLFGLGTRQYEYDTNLWAAKCDIAPFGERIIAESALNKKSTYEKALLTVSYESRTAYESDPAGEGNYTGADLCEETVTIDPQYLSLSSGKAYWDNAQAAALVDGQMPERIVSTKTYTITLHNIQQVPQDFDELIGTINIAAYSLVSEIIHGGTLHEYWVPRTGNLLYLGYALDRAITGFGTAGWNMTLTFAEILNGVDSNAWNYFFNPDTQTWSQIYDAAGNAIEFYDQADWTNIGLPPIYVAP